MARLVPVAGPVAGVSGSFGVPGAELCFEDFLGMRRRPIVEAERGCGPPAPGVAAPGADAAFSVRFLFVFAVCSLAAAAPVALPLFLCVVRTAARTLAAAALALRAVLG